MTIRKRTAPTRAPVKIRRAPAPPRTRPAPPNVPVVAPPAQDAVLLAELKPTAQPGSVYTLTSTVSVPEQYSGAEWFWFVDGAAADRRPIALDSNGLPRTWQVVAPVNMRRSGNYKLTASKELPAKLDPVALMHPRVQAQIVCKGKSYVATAPAPTVKFAGAHLTESKSFARFKELGGSEQLMGCHFYFQRTTYGWELAVRISNACINVDGSGFCGEVYFEDLKLKIDNSTYSLAPSLPVGQSHVFLPLYQMHRRYSGGLPLVYARAQGECSLHVKGFGAEDQGLPEFTSDYSSYGKLGMDAKEQELKNDLSRLKNGISSGVADIAVELYTNKLGPFMPMYLGDSGSGAPGGWGITPVAMEAAGQSQTAVDLLKLRHQCMMDRMPNKVYDMQGNTISTYDFAAINGGVQPFYHNVIGGWKVDWIGGTQNVHHEQGDVPPYFPAQVGKPWNQGSCPYIGGIYSGLLSYSYIDDAHYCRATRYPKALVYLVNDQISKDDLIDMAEFVHYSYPEYQHKLMWPEQGSHSPWKYMQVFGQPANMNRGAPIERAYGWSMDTMAQAHAVAPQAWRTKNRPWFKAIETLMQTVLMPNHLVERQAGGPNGCQAAKDAIAQEGFPADQDIAGSIYVGIVSQGMYAIAAQMGPRSPLNKIVSDMIAEMFDYSGITDGPAHYQAVAPIGGAPYDHLKFTTGREIFNHWWGLADAYKAAVPGTLAAGRHLERARRYVTFKPTEAEKVKWFMQTRPAYMECALYYIAIAQRM